MAFRIGRTLPPAAAPIYLRDIVSGFTGLLRGEKTVEKFRGELRDHYQVGQCFTVSSGKAALTMILEALKNIYPDRDEVLIPAFCCYSVPSAIVRAGLKVSLCDLDPETFDFDFGQLSTIISNGKRPPLCVVAVHLFGMPADIARLRGIINDATVVIVEDAAQAMGGEYDGRKLGTLGDVGFFSLGRGKAISTVEGGLILTSSGEMADEIRKIMDKTPNYGLLEQLGLLLYSVALLILLRPVLFWIPKAVPFLSLGETIYDPSFRLRKMSPFQAGLAAGWQKKLRQFIVARTENMCQLLNSLKKIGLCPAWAECGPLPSLLRLPLFITDDEERDYLLRMSEQTGLGIAGTYPDSIDSIGEMNYKSANNRFPVAKEYARRLLTLPIHPYVNGKDKVRIADLLSQAIKS
jgi:perosamine synthetase